MDGSYIEKALKRINELIEQAKENSDEHIDFIVIKQACEKQIPLQPFNEGKTFSKHWVCPSCGRLYWEKESINNYCDSCGQKFDLEA